MSAWSRRVVVDEDGCAQWPSRSAGAVARRHTGSQCRWRQQRGHRHGPARHQVGRRQCRRASDSYAAATGFTQDSSGPQRHLHECHPLASLSGSFTPGVTDVAWRYRSLHAGEWRHQADRLHRSDADAPHETSSKSRCRMTARAHSTSSCKDRLDHAIEGTTRTTSRCRSISPATDADGDPASGNVHGRSVNDDVPIQTDRPGHCRPCRSRRHSRAGGDAAFTLILPVGRPTGSAPNIERYPSPMGERSRNRRRFVRAALTPG